MRGGMGIGMGRRGAYVSLFFFFSFHLSFGQGSFQGPRWTTCDWSDVVFTLLFFLSCCYAMMMMNPRSRPQVRALLLWIECFPSSHEFFHDEQSRAPAAGSTKSSGRLLVDLLLGMQAGRGGMARVGNLGRWEDGIQAKEGSDSFRESRGSFT